MTNKEKLINRLTSTKDGFELVDVKFSMGANRFISEDAFCEAVLSGILQVDAGKAVAISPSAVDGNFKSRPIGEFLA